MVFTDKHNGMISVGNNVSIFVRTAYVKRYNYLAISVAEYNSDQTSLKPVE